MLLELKNITVCYGTAVAARNVSVGVEEGTIVTIVGPNGAGKSTTIRAISGQNPLTSGEIWFDGARIDGKSIQRIARLGVIQVPQGKQLFPEMTVVENLKVGAYIRKDRSDVKKSIDSVFEHFPRLEERRKEQAKKLSGGEQQMLAIGRGLMANPRLLLLDEPSLGLAPVLVGEMARVISGINKQGVSIVLVEQNALMALRISNKGYVLEAGQIVLEGEAKALLSDERVKKAYLGF